MKRKQLLGLLLGTGLFALAIAIPFEGLELAGRITLGIFLLAAVFWILEPVPIYATSMLVILLQVMLLSSRGLVFTVDAAPVLRPEAEQVAGEAAYRLPEAALTSDGKVYLKEGRQSVRSVPAPALAGPDGGWVRVAADALGEAPRVIADAGHRSVAQRSPAFSVFYATLASPIVMLFLGGFALAASAVKYGLDKNLTRVLLRPFGSQPRFVCLGLMVCTAVLSAFMSNTATTAMMMTVVLPIVGGMAPGDPFRKGVALSIPVAANIGGIATPIGTPPNAIALAALRESGLHVSFALWMLLAVPFVVLLLAFAWRMLMVVFKPEIERFEVAMEGEFDKSPKALLAYAVFAVTVGLWITEMLHGLSTTMVAFIPVALLPALGVLDKSDIRSFSWEVLWLVAGGISLGLSMKDTGLAAWLIGQVSWTALGGIGVVAVFGLVGYALSNLISNTVTATMLMPLAITVGAGLAAAGDFNLVAAVVAIAVIVSCSMLLPISTPPNAIAVATGVIETRDMAKSGSLVGIAGFLLTLLMTLFYWPRIVG